MNRNVKILFVRLWKSSFIQKDLELLEKHFEVRVVDFVISRKNLKDTFDTLFKMFAGTLWADVTLSWFADNHAFWAVRLSNIFRKKSVVVVGGYEVAKVPEIGYGAMLNPESARFVKYMLDNAIKVLAVSEFNKKEILKYTSSKNVELVYNGVDYNKFKPNKTKENFVVTVGGINKNTVQRKGMESFVKSASYLPTVRFVVIGSWLDGSIEYLKSLATQNVQFLGFVSDQELIEWYQKSKVYCQLSFYESFGMSVAEAMLCECVPVVVYTAALPEVVGDAGFYVPYGDPKTTAKAIKEALKSDKGKEARKRIKSMFPIERREKELTEIIRCLVGKKNENIDRI